MAVVNAALVQTNIAALKRGSEHVQLLDSPRDKLRKSMSKRLVITTTENREDGDTLEFLRNTSVKDVPFASNFCSKTLLNEDDCIAKAIDSLLTKKIACAQVVKGSDTVGIFDIGDLAVYCCSRFKEAKDTASEVLKLEEEFLEMPLKKFLVTNNWKSIHKDDSLLELVKLFTSPQCDRVIVKDDTSAIGILTRSEFVSYIHKNKNHLNSKLDLHVKECQMSNINQTSADSENVRNAFNGLWLKQTSGLLASGSLMSSLRKFLNLIQYVHCTVQDNRNSSEDDDDDDSVVRIADTLEQVLDMMSDRNTGTVRVLDHSGSKYLHFYHVLQVFQPLTSS